MRMTKGSVTVMWPSTRPVSVAVSRSGVKSEQQRQAGDQGRQQQRREEEAAQGVAPAKLALVERQRRRHADEPATGSVTTSRDLHAQAAARFISGAFDSSVREPAQREAATAETG